MYEYQELRKSFEHLRLPDLIPKTHDSPKQFHLIMKPPKLPRPTLAYPFPKDTFDSYQRMFWPKLYMFHSNSLSSIHFEELTQIVI